MRRLNLTSRDTGLWADELERQDIRDKQEQGEELSEAEKKFLASSEE